MNLAAANGLVADAWILGTCIGAAIVPNRKRTYNRPRQEVNMPSKFCLGCRQLTTNGSRCEQCQAGMVAAMNRRPKGNTTQRGLGQAHRVKAKAVIAAAQVCAICGRPPTSNDPLTADHVVPRSQGGGDGPLRAVHRSCNSREGGKISRGGGR